MLHRSMHCVIMRETSSIHDTPWYSRILNLETMTIEALHVTYDTVSMADCSNAFKRSMITTPTLPFVLLIIKSLLSL